MAEQLSTYDPAAALDSEEAITVFMADAFETGDAAYIAKALGVVARAQGMIRLPGKRGFHANSFTALSAKMGTQR